ncbi:unnamed protein product [Mytilus edulis]|uniref:Uncharacterized protein n=1 Tax=Mytilus edulis TaxID=6550 RepID=A0A8S3VRA5_MYTED|nr:unnamed protein product [Mytilus edulis]
MDDTNLNVVLAVNDNDTIQSFNNSEAVSGFKSNYNRIREHEPERKQHEFMLTQLMEKTQKAETSKQNAEDCARKAEMERRVAEQKIEQLEKEKHNIQKQKEELEKEQNFTKTGFEMISYRIREHETERKEHAFMLTQLIEQTQNAETSKRSAEDCARKAEMEKGVAENKIKILEKEKHDIQNQKEELEKEQNITKTGLEQHIQLNQQNEKTIHKLEIQLQTLTEQIKKTQEDKKIAKNQAGNTIQQKQLYLDKAHKTIVRMERIIEKSEEEDAMKKWQNFRSKNVEKDMQKIKAMKAVLEAVVEEDTKTTQSTACTVS